MCFFSVLKGGGFRSRDHQRGEVLHRDFVPLVLVRWDISPSAGTAEMETRWQTLGLHAGSGAKLYWDLKN